MKKRQGIFLRMMSKGGFKSDFRGFMLKITAGCIRVHKCKLNEFELKLELELLLSRMFKFKSKFKFKFTLTVISLPFLTSLIFRV